MTLFLGSARGYVRVHNYIQAGRALMNAFGIQQIFLVTDSQGAIDEAMACATNYPEICGNLTFRYLEKKRWLGAEGGEYRDNKPLILKLSIPQDGRILFPQEVRVWSFWIFKQNSL